MDAWLTKVVKDSLEQNLLRNATFVGERLYASYPTEVSYCRRAVARLQAEHSIIWGSRRQTHIYWELATSDPDNIIESWMSFKARSSGRPRHQTGQRV